MSSLKTTTFAAATLLLLLAPAADAVAAANGAAPNTAAHAFARGDYAEAREGYERLARDGNAFAEFRLALMYTRGLGGSRDLAGAAFWLGCAARQSSALAREARGLEAEMAALGTVVRPGKAEACPTPQAPAPAGVALAPTLTRDSLVERLVYLPGDLTVAAALALADALHAPSVQRVTGAAVGRYGNQLLGTLAAIWWALAGFSLLRLVDVLDRVSLFGMLARMVGWFGAIFAWRPGASSAPDGVNHDSHKHA